MSIPEICVIIVNYGTADLTITAVQSVLNRAEDGRIVHVNVVDNASPGNDAQMLEEAYAKHRWTDRVTLHLQQENHGFGGGNNIVLHSYKNSGGLPDKVMLLNPDAALENNAVDILARFLEVTPTAGFAGAAISKPDGTKVTAAFRFPNAVAAFAQNLNFGPITSLFQRWHVPLSPSHPAGKVDWVSGASVMVRKQALEEVGFFDTNYFLYFEEVDLMRQASLRGWDTWYVPKAKVIHAEGAATGVKSGVAERKRKPSYWYHSWQYYHWKNLGTLGALVAGLGYLTGMLGERIIVRLRGRKSQSPLNGMSDFWHRAMWPIMKGKNKQRSSSDHAGLTNANP